MLQLILGISGSGKSRCILEEVAARARKGQRSILLVPEQFTSSTERRIYQTLGDELSGFADSYSFTSLAEKLLQKYGGVAVSTLTDAGRVVLVRRAIESLGEQVVYYHRSRRNTAFCQMAAEAISELKNAGVTGEQLSACAESAGSGKEKMRELALIYSAYEALLQGTAMDPSDRVELAAASMDASDFAGIKIFVDEFDTFNASKRRLLRKLLSATDVTVALCADRLEDIDHGMGLFSNARKVGRELIRLAHQAEVTVKTPLVLSEDRRHSSSEELEALNRLLAGEELSAREPAQNITLYCAENRREEARAVAAAVRRRAMEGVPYSKMAVICRNAEDYLSAVRYAFRLADIPLFFDEPVTPENTAPARAVKAAVELLRRGISTENILALVKTGLTSLSEEQQCALENYAYTWPLRAADWREPFKRPPSGYDGDRNRDDEENLALAEAARCMIMEQVGPFLEKSRGENAMGISRQIYFLLEKLGAEQAVNSLAETLRKEAGLPAAEEAIREWNIAMSLLDQIARLLGEGIVDPGEYGEMFGLLLRSTDMGHIPETQDAVFFTTAGRMRLDEVEAAFVIGLSEGEFPKAPGESGLLTNADRDVLLRQGVDLPSGFDNRLILEKLSFYKALTTAQKSLWLSWPGGAAGGVPLTEELAPVLAIFLPAAPLLDMAGDAPTPAAALDELGRRWQQNDVSTASLYAALREAEEAFSGLKTVERIACDTPFEAKDLEQLEKLLGAGMYISPSKVERFYSCPFGYFMEYVLRVRPRRRAELSPNQSGSLVHWVLENALRRTGSEFKKLDELALQMLAAGLTDEYVRENMPDTSTRFAYLVSRLKRTVGDLLLYLQKDMKQSRFVPTAFEQTIGSGGVPPVRLTASDGHPIQIIGTIDRVDTFESEGKTWLRVVDYKTGEKHFKLEDVYCGLDCQMLMYLFTLTRNGGELYEEPAPGGVLYLMADPAPRQDDRAASAEEKKFRLDGLVANIGSVIDAMDSEHTGAFIPLTFNKNGAPRASEKLADLAKLGRIERHIDKLVVEMADRLYGGSVPAAPIYARSKKPPCQYCDYRSVCRHEDGQGELQVTMPKEYFDHDPEERKEGEADE